MAREQLLRCGVRTVCVVLWVSYPVSRREGNGFTGPYSLTRRCREHDDECAAIARNAQALYDRFVSREGILDYLQMISCEIASRFRVSPSWCVLTCCYCGSTAPHLLLLRQHRTARHLLLLRRHRTAPHLLLLRQHRTAPLLLRQHRTARHLLLLRQHRIAPHLLLLLPPVPSGRYQSPPLPMPPPRLIPPAEPCADVGGKRAHCTRCAEGVAEDKVRSPLLCLRGAQCVLCLRGAQCAAFLPMPLSGW